MARVGQRSESGLGQSDPGKARLGNDQRPLHVVRNNETDRELMKQAGVATFLFQQAGDHFVQMAFPVLQPIDLVTYGLGDGVEPFGFVFVELQELFGFGK